MALSGQEVRRTIAAAHQLQFNAPSVRIENFIAGVLGLNPVQRVQYFPNPDPKGLLETAIAYLTEEREKRLRDDCEIPEFAVFQDAQKDSYIAGLGTYLASKQVDARLRGRLTHHQRIKNKLRSIQRGHDLEAVAAAIMNAECDYGEATRGSGDQGIDVIGWSRLILIEPSFSEGDFIKNGALPGEKVFLFASSKALTVGQNDQPALINPAHIRELVGGWSIQRSSVGKWQSVGIRMLSPVQMVLVTTYRLSLEAKAECRALGVQIWGIPELVYLICHAAPDSVFDPANNYHFSTTDFDAWWRVRIGNRVMA